MRGICSQCNTTISCVRLYSSHDRPGAVFDRDLLPRRAPLARLGALIALPLLLDFALEAIFNWDAWYVTWLLTFLTFGALLVVSLWPLVGMMKQGSG